MSGNIVCQFPLMSVFVIPWILNYVCLVFMCMCVCVCVCVRACVRTDVRLACRRPSAHIKTSS